MSNDVRFTFPPPPEKWGQPMPIESALWAGMWILDEVRVMRSLNLVGPNQAEWHISCSVAGAKPSDQTVGVIRRDFSVPIDAKERTDEAKKNNEDAGRAHTFARHFMWPAEPTERK